MHTERGTRRRSPVRGPLGAVAALVAGGAGVWTLAPGGLGREDPVRITIGASASGYRELSGLAGDGPGWLGGLLELATEGTLIALGLLLLRAGWCGWRDGRMKDPRLVGAVLTGVGTVVAYGVSEAVKLVVDEERPCRALAGAHPVAECPPPGDWSFPSNHATLAAALAVGLALTLPRLAAVTLPLAGAAALLRVLVGVHYPHDVLAGALLGAACAVAAVVMRRAPLGDVRRPRVSGGLGVPPARRAWGSSSPRPSGARPASQRQGTGKP
ncbi:phosphatase PAP2 family protein [Streptomyces oryzae]|uniref:Phosphatase PAP2 family protein n=1 Tax=Streptomyces oryzae TaxID=1434886 RepID=A0ABS3XIR2_9ACTN|nr:phosphatase PAP2 family protein [Streptomyces oryzae]MBO8195297.1 phosphatase PAP2 family protein [Streptomyces oryzae]